MTAPTTLRPFDLVIVALYLVGITLFGLRFRRKGAAAKSLQSYFLADNAVPWWAIALSIVSAETSTLTIISVPGVAFGGDFGFLQIVLGYMLGRVVVAALFLPRYFAGQMLTAYQLIDQRFGATLHKVTAGLFLLTRAAAEGVRVFAVSIVVSIAIGTGDVLSIAIITLLTLLYTFEGGMAAVIWTDVVQMVIYVAGTLIACASLGSHVPGGWSAIHEVASAAGKFHMLNFAMDLTTTYTFWAGLIGGAFLTMASHGTDQLMVQRMLAARNLRESRLALLSSGVVIFIQFTLFLLIGVGLWALVHSGLWTLSPGTSSSDRIFPSFIVQKMPVGIAGLMVAAILAAAMSNLSAALNSLASTTVIDFYLPLRHKKPVILSEARTQQNAVILSEAHSAEPKNTDAADPTLTTQPFSTEKISRAATLLWAVILFAIAVYSVQHGGKGHVVETGLSIASVAYGSLLGVFLLGTLTRYATQTGAILGMITGFAFNLTLWLAPGKILLSGWTYTPAANQHWNQPPVLLAIPHVAFTWYVLLGALVTFLIGTLFSLILPKRRPRIATTSAALLLLLFFLSFPEGICFSARAQSPAPLGPSALGPDPSFSQVSTLITDAIAAHKLPGAVVLIGHSGHIVFEHAYGNRKLAGEPGLDGKPSPAEAMTEDTIFDMASLTKCLATATAVMQLYEAGKITSFDDPVETYLPDFNPAHDPQRARVSLRMLLTHTSGEAPDVPLKDPWGLAAPARAEGFHRALTTPLHDEPGKTFTYSDINFILLGLLVEKLSGQREDDYVRDHIYKPLGMTQTRFLPLDKACGATTIGVAVVSAHETRSCTPAQWFAISLLPHTAPTTHDDEGNAQTNPHFDMLTRGTVHDPTTRRMGGVAGHAGLFSTAHDVSLFAQALLDKLNRNTGPFPLKQATLRLMTQPEQPTDPGAPHLASEMWVSRELAAANAAQTISTTDPLLAAAYPAIKGQNLRGFGWDIDTAFSKPRGRIFPVGSFGHTGFTGTSLWIDPASDTYVILLANAVHPRGNPPISSLRGEVATAAAAALGLRSATGGMQILRSAQDDKTGNDPTMTGIDVLESTHFAALSGFHHIGLLTNQTGIDANRKRTIDVLHAPTTDNRQLTTLFSPEHGILGALDQSHVDSTTDPATHLPVISLYGAKDSERRPTHEQLKDLDAVVIDLQDAGVHYWTYESVLGYFLEAAAREQREFHHRLEIVVLDRPDLVAADVTQGPTVDQGRESYVGYMPVPSRLGLTFGELARYINRYKLYSDTPRADGKPDALDAPLTVIAMTGYRRSMFFADTGLPWVSPSPNLRSPEAAVLYPGIGLIETTNISVGRGVTGGNVPFTFFGASWMDAKAVAAALTARNIPGATFAPDSVAIAEDANHYPFHGQTIPIVRVTVTDRAALDTPELGIEIAAVLHRLYPTDYKPEKGITNIMNKATIDALLRGDDPRAIARTWQPAIDEFRKAVAPILLYR